MKSVIFGTVYPAFAGRRCEFEITKAMLSTPLQDIALSALIVSAHAEPLEKAKAEFASLSVPIEYVHLPTRYAGKRKEEISYCKRHITKRLWESGSDYILFMDADVWTSLEGLPEWIRIVDTQPRKKYVHIKYCLRTRLASPVVTLGAYFHHRDLLSRTRYWNAIFPKNPRGKRRGAPDCNIYRFLRHKFCKRIVPKELLTHHFQNRTDANTYFQGKCVQSLGLNSGDQFLFRAPDVAREHPMSIESVKPREVVKVPLVSAVMITGKAPGQRSLAEVALRCFLDQDYPNKELLIVNDGPVPLASGATGVREIMVDRTPRRTLGDLRNVGLEAARGEWIIQWEDDDWHAPSRISLQMKGAAKKRANLLGRQIRFSLVTNSGGIWKSKHGIPGTLLHAKSDALRYPSLHQGEDTLFLRKFKRRRVIDNPAVTHVSFHHGGNTWGERHSMKRIGKDRNSLALPDDQKRVLLNSILPAYFAPEAAASTTNKLFMEPLNWSLTPWVGMKRTPKIFGIGLSNMGGRILARALGKFGISTVKCPKCVDEIERRDAAIGDSATCYYRELTALFPGSIVVVLNRKKERWLAACENHWKKRGGCANAFALRIRGSLFGSTHFSKEGFARAYDEFQSEAAEWLGARSTPTLVIDVTTPEWKTDLKCFLSGHGWKLP